MTNLSFGVINTLYYLQKTQFKYLHKLYQILTYAILL